MYDVRYRQFRLFPNKTAEAYIHNNQQPDKLDMNATESTPEDALTDVIDLEHAAKRIPGGLEGVRKLAKMLLVECPKLTGQMREAISNQDATLLRRAAHTLKSSADIFGAKRVKDLCAQLEIMGQDEKLDEAEDAFNNLEIEVDTLVAAVNRL
jgi:two-component system sensor histidine kinase/response regulator